MTERPIDCDKFGQQDGLAVGDTAIPVRHRVNSMGNATMRRKILTILPLVGALTIASGAQAAIRFVLSGNGVSASGELTVGPDPYADTGAVFGTPANLVTVSPTAPSFQGVVDPSNALAVTGVTGVFSDAIGIVGATITGLVATNPPAITKRITPSSIVSAGLPGIPATRSSLMIICSTQARRSPITC